MNDAISVKGLVILQSATVNDKSFEGEKFCGLLGSSKMVCGEKFHDFFLSPPSSSHKLE